MTTHMSKKVTFASLSGNIKFHEESIEEHLVYYDGDNTHSCIYLFNPKTKQQIDNSFTLANVTQRTTSTYT